LAQQASYKLQLDQLQLAASLKTGGSSVVTTAQPPSTPFKPTPVRTGVKGLIVGIVFGVAMAALLEFLDDSIKTKDEVEKVAPDLPVMALVPPVPSWKDRSKPVVVSLTEPKSTLAEAYRTLRTSIQFMSLDRPMKTVQVTSPIAREGKTTTAANLGVALARSGQRVVIVDCDLRKPRLHEFFDLANEQGFTSVLLGDSPLSGALQAVAEVPNLLVLSSGPQPPNPSELLSGRRTVEVLVALQAGADVVIIDSPPLLPVTDSVILSGRVDATVVVATAGTTTRRQLHRALELLQQVDAPVVGTVLNRAAADGSYGYYNQYGYGYSYGGGGNHKKGKRSRESATRG
jgi:capsular exopolysaccharide synthesis family protein